MADTYSVYFGTVSGSLDLIASGLEVLEIAMPIEGVLGYNIIYYWRVDVTNEYGTTPGDEWYFTSIVFASPSPATGGTGGGGGAGEESSPTGENNMITLRRLVAAANSKIWFEDI